MWVPASKVSEISFIFSHLLALNRRWMASLLSSVWLFKNSLIILPMGVALSGKFMQTVGWFSERRLNINLATELFPDLSSPSKTMSFPRLIIFMALNKAIYLIVVKDNFNHSLNHFHCFLLSLKISIKFIFLLGQQKQKLPLLSDPLNLFENIAVCITSLLFEYAQIAWWKIQGQCWRRFPILFSNTYFFLSQNRFTASF